MTNTKDTDEKAPSFRDEMGRWRTQSLFFEFYIKGETGAKYPPVFTLKEREWQGLPSMKQLFLSYEDPTGYAFAIAVLGSYSHWKKLCTLKWFNEHLSEWQDELEVRLRSKGLRNVVNVAKGTTASAFNASKWLADRGWAPKRGRPSATEKKAELKRQTQIEEAIEADAERMGNVVKIK